VIPVSRALEDYVRRADVAPLRSYPRVWAGHYSGGKLLGEYAVPEVPRQGLARLCLGVMVPFGLTPEIDASYLVVDALKVPNTETYFETSQVLYVSSLQTTGGGVLITHWSCPFRPIKDIRTVYGPAERTWSKVPGLDTGLSEVTNLRLGKPLAAFDTAYQAALVVMQETFEPDASR
jgi:hypothetical protein